jgi:hypothetical protein
MVSETVKRNYWEAIRRTRKSGRIAQSVIDRVEESWNKFDDDVIEEALNIHLRRYGDYKENYTLGIMRNLQKRKASGAPVRKKNSFNDFEQRKYDYDELERMILSSPVREGE